MADDGYTKPEQVTGELAIKPVQGPVQGPARDQCGRLLKGHSGNPTGRPKAERDVVELARRCTPEVIKRLLYIAMRGSIRDGATVRACELLLERGYGKAPITITDEDGNKMRVGIIILPGERSDDDGE